MMLPPSTSSDSRATHHGTMGSLAELSPFGCAYCLPYPGIRMGQYESGEPFRLDIHLWKRLGLFDAPIVFTDGEIGAGKTSLAIIAALYASLLAVEQNRRFKIMYEITRRNVGVAELDSLTVELNATVKDMSTYGLNIFDQMFGLTPAEQLDVILECFNYIERRDATTLEITLIMSALRVFLQRCESDERYKRTATNRYFEKCLANLTTAQAREAIASNAEWFEDEGNVTDESAEFEDDSEYLKDAVLAVGDIEFNEEEFYETRNNVLLSIVRLRKGEYGRVFSGKHSFTELLDQDAVGIDLSNLNDATIGLVQTLLWKFKRSAANSSDPERRRRFVFDWEIHDENRESWLHAPYRREVPRYLKRIRSVNCVMWFNLHRIPGDFVTLPEEARLAALNAVREGKIFFHGQHDDVQASETCEHFGYSNVVKNKMMVLKKGEFIFKVGSLPPQKIKIILSTSQLRITFSEAASQQKTKVSKTLAALSGRL